MIEKILSDKRQEILVLANKTKDELELLSTQELINLQSSATDFTPVASGRIANEIIKEVCEVILKERKHVRRI